MDLGNVAPLMKAWQADPWGRLRPPLSREAMELSARLAQATYRMDVEEWIRAGWRDVTIQVDGDLTDGIQTREGSAMGRLSQAWKMFRVRSKIRGANPIGQVWDAFRQKDGSSTGKAVVMIHPAPLGRYVVAIGFMGTGERIQDWVPNFRLSVQGGVHQGFMELARQFEGNEEDIDFPETAQALGLDKLTLRHVLEEARRPDSRFILWLTGHSQGAALVQVYAHHKITEDGVLPRNMIGYGMAAPSVMSGRTVSDPAAYPLYLLQNSDDFVPRMGSLVHLGVCLTYPAGEVLRDACYTWRRDEVSAQARERVAKAVAPMQDTPSIMEVLMAFLRTLSCYTAEDMIEALNTLGLRLPVKGLLNAADARMDALVQFGARHLAACYASMMGSPMDMQRVAAHQAELEAAVEALGLKAFCHALMELMTQPHRISRKHDTEAPYLYIAKHGLDALQPAVWRSGMPPQWLYAPPRHRIAPERRVHRHPRYQDPRQHRPARRKLPIVL